MDGWSTDIETDRKTCKYVLEDKDIEKDDVIDRQTGSNKTRTRLSKLGVRLHYI